MIVFVNALISFQTTTQTYLKQTTEVSSGGWGLRLKLLRVDLSSGSMRDEFVDEDEVKLFIGGRGLGVKILIEELKPGTDPLGPENKLLFMTGPATGTAFPTSGRFHVVTKSPQTGGIGETDCGGTFGPELRFAGYDGVIIEGKAAEPVYLWIRKGEAEIRPAGRYWGKGTWYTEDGIRKELGDHDIKIASIGPAGENLVLCAAIINDKHRAAGRTAAGAVMGSKRLKAIVVRGTKRPPVADEKKLKEAVQKVLKMLKESRITGHDLPTYGTAITVGSINEHGLFPTRNFQTGVFPTAEKISGETLAKTILIKSKGCWGCPIDCGRVIRVTQSPYQVEGEGPEYEEIWALGAQCYIDDLNAVAKANNLCDELGMDPVSYGNTVGCAMELGERGKISKEKLGGLELKFGNPQAIVELTWRTAYRLGFGNDIALGAKRLAEKYGAPELAMHVKGLELPAYDPRGAQGQGLAYATSNRGGCHLGAHMIGPEIFGVPQQLNRFATEGKAQWVKKLQDLFAICDSAVFCNFATFAIWVPEIVEMLNAITGWGWSPDELLKAGDRIYTLERLFISREGFGRKDDTLPRRLLEEPMPEGPSKGHVVKLGAMLDEYYALRGWKDGKPTPQKLKELGLNKYA
ncbi:MAG: aldehyde ferredoxin oxidoreductase family protein [Hadesarchaea archaeon]|nr:aldehyde ferredoxin oxidoreductase family protein [Hadesarchaea archaeon]